MTPGSDESLLPGQELVHRGLADLAEGRTTECSLLVLLAGPRLRRLGLRVEERPDLRPYAHQLYARLEGRLGTAAHSHYNSLLRRIDSYAHAREREASSPC